MRLVYRRQGLHHGIHPQTRPGFKAPQTFDVAEVANYGWCAVDFFPVATRTSRRARMSEKNIRERKQKPGYVYVNKPLFRGHIQNFGTDAFVGLGVWCGAFPSLCACQGHSAVRFDQGQVEKNP